MNELKILLFNMHHGRGMDGKSNLARIVKLVKEIDPDIAGFNEVDRFFSKRSGFEDQFGWFCGQLGMQCAFGAAITRKKDTAVREYGNALFSRYPILSHTNHGLRSRRLTISEPRAVLETEIALPTGSKLKVYLTHLSFIRVLRKVQADLVARRVEADKEPALLMGDFNMIPWSGAWKRLAGPLRDTATGTTGTPVPTFPSIRPFTQKDYIFASPSIRVLGIQTVLQDRGASDHLPLLATVSLPAPETGT